VVREAHTHPARLTLRRLAEMADAEPALREQQPWKASYEKDFGWLGAAMVKH